VGASRTLIILAGGLSRRMGRDKANLPTGAGTLLERIVERLSPVVDEVVVAGGPSLSIPEGRWVPDARSGAGPLAGMAAGLAAVSFDLAWVVACDLPDVEPGVGELLFDSASDVDAVVPRLDGRPECLCAVYRASLAGRILTLLNDGERRVTALLDGIRVRYVEAAELRRVDPELRSFRNLNTPEEYQDWVTSLR
jgi:molybdopterin-guanine dinucleotide biosynthesis protein A